MGRHRICALHELLDRNHPDHTLLLQECQLAYTFVVGGNETGLTQRVDDIVAEPITLPSLSTEPDVVLLNIRENMNQGKSETYFKYGLSISDDHIYFDYIAKADGDTLLYVDRFLDRELNRLPTFPDNGLSYGGSLFLPRPDIVDSNMEGTVFFTGDFYFLSPDMARFITSDACDRNRTRWYTSDGRWSTFNEDWAIGLHLDLYPRTLHRMRVGQTNHPIKNPKRYQSLWDDYIGRPGAP